MPSLNKQSLREEFDQLKGEFGRLSQQGKITAESRTLFHAMIMLFELLIAVFMEKTTKKAETRKKAAKKKTKKKAAKK